MHFKGWTKYSFATNNYLGTCLKSERLTCIIFKFSLFYLIRKFIGRIKELKNLADIEMEISSCGFSINLSWFHLLRQENGFDESINIHCFARMCYLRWKIHVDNELLQNSLYPPYFRKAFKNSTNLYRIPSFESHHSRIRFTEISLEIIKSFLIKIFPIIEVNMQMFDDEIPSQW